MGGSQHSSAAAAVNNTAHGNDAHSATCMIHGAVCTNSTGNAGHGNDQLAFWWFLLVAIFVGCLLDALIKALSHSKSFCGIACKPKLPPYTAAVFMLGMVMAWAVGNDNSRWEVMVDQATLGEVKPQEVVHNENASWTTIARGGNELYTSLRTWLKISPHTVLFVLLPPLLFEDAASIQYFVFRRVFWSCVLLASVGVLICTCMSTLLFKAMLPLIYDEADISWVLCALIGCILSATDPVAVIAVLNTLGAPDRLSMLIAGESLLNDGTAVVIFLLLEQFLVECEEPPTAMGMLKQGAQLSLGGPLLGLAAFGLVWITHSSMVGQAHHTCKSMILVACTFAAFYVGEHHLGVSGVLAVVVLGVLYSRFSHVLDPGGHFGHGNHVVWQCLAWVATTVIFLITGLIIADLLIVQFRTRSTVQLMGFFLVLLVIYIMLFVIRATMLLILSPVLSKMGYGLTKREGGMLTWGALRGAVSMAMALLIGQNPKVPCSVQVIVLEQVAAVVALTLIINAPTSAMMYNWLNIYPKNNYRQKLDVQSVANLMDYTHKQVEEMTAGDSGKEYAVDGFHLLAQPHIIRALTPCYRDAVLSEHGELQNEVITPFEQITRQEVDMGGESSANPLQRQAGADSDSPQTSPQAPSKSTFDITKLSMVNEHKDDENDLAVRDTIYEIITTTIAVHIDELEHHTIITPRVEAHLEQALVEAQAQTLQTETEDNLHHTLKLNAFFKNVISNQPLVITDGTPSIAYPWHTVSERAKARFLFAELLFALQCVYGVRSGIMIVRKRKMMDLLDDDDEVLDDLIKDEMDGVEQGCKDYREALETTYPKLMQLAHSVFLHRFLVEKISDKSTELVAHGLLAVRLRHMIVRSLFRRVNKIQNYFDDHCGLYASMMITLNPITKRSCMAITEAYDADVGGLASGAAMVGISESDDVMT